MSVNVVNVEIGAKYQERIYDFWIIGKLKNGNVIKIFDFIPLNLTKYIGKNINLLITGFLIEEHKKVNDIENTFSGIISEEYKIPLDVINKSNNMIQVKKMIKFQTDMGTILLNPSELKNMTYQFNKQVNLTIGRFDLIGIL